LAVIRLGISVFISGPDTTALSIWLQLAVVPIFALSVALMPWLAIRLFTGFAQWIFLRRHYQGVGWWVLVTAAAVVLGAAGWIYGSICGGAFTWVAAGALTGFLLLGLMQQPLR
jgi:hypothetical protein